VTDADFQTVLVLEGIGVPLYSTRFATQTLDPIGQAAVNTYRDVNGVLRSVAATQFRKYRSVITCTDMWPFAIGGTWPGQLVTVDCIAHLNYLTSSGSAEREVVSGSEREVGLFTFYRPRLEMMVLNFTSAEDENRKDAPWSMELEEV
jgi:hypothetical protein